MPETLDEQIARMERELAILKKQKNEKSYTSYRERYLDWMRNQTRILRTQGLLPKQRDGLTPIDIALQDIYIPLDVSSFEIRDKNRSLCSDDVSQMEDEQLPDDEQKKLMKRMECSSEKVEKREPMINLLKQKRSVLIGGAGSGKTTFVNYAAGILCDEERKKKEKVENHRIPMIISFRDIAQKGTSFFQHLDIEHFYQELIDPKLIEHSKKEDQDFFENNLREGNFFIFFDGMDEVAETTLRENTTDMIRKVLEKYPDNLCLITSRPVGYLQGSLMSDCKHFRVVDFSQTQVEKFVSQWYLKTLTKTEGNTEFARELADKESKKVLEAMKKVDSLRRFATNPLLLTLIVIVHRYRGTLPERRVDLYDECLDVLLNYWPQQRGIKSPFELRHKLFVLEEVAWQLHKQEKRDATRDELLKMIEKPLKNMLPSASPEDFLKELSGNCLIFEERGINVYGFFHLSFQEYLTACYIADELKWRELADFLDAKKHGKKRNWWVETALLYCGKEKKVDAYLKKISTLAEAKHDDCYRNNFFLLCQCLANATSPPETLTNETIELFTGMLYKGNDMFVRERARQTLPELNIGTFSDKIMDSIISRDDTFMYSARNLGILGNGRAVEPLIAALKNEANRGAYGYIAYALGEIGSERAVEPLIAALKDEKNRAMYEDIAEALAKINNENTIDLLQVKLKSIKESRTKLVFAYLMAKSGSVDELRSMINRHERIDIDWELKNLLNIPTLGSITVHDAALFCLCNLEWGSDN